MSDAAAGAASSAADSMRGRFEDQAPELAPGFGAGGIGEPHAARIAEPRVGGDERQHALGVGGPPVPEVFPDDLAGEGFGFFLDHPGRPGMQPQRQGKGEFELKGQGRA